MPAKSKDYGRVWYAANREACIAKSKAWQKANPDKVTALYERSKPRRAAQMRARRAAKKLEAAGRPAPSHCEACGEVAPLVWDHDHATGKFRGWICSPCNLALGMTQDNPIRLRALADYVSPNSNFRIN